VRVKRALLVGCAAVTAAAAATSVALASGGQQCAVQHWGMFTGGGTTQEAKWLSPTSVKIPGSSPVIQVASSNSDEYALLANGTVWAWGLGQRYQLGDGNVQNALRTAVQVNFPAGVRIAYLPTNSLPFDTGLAVDTTGHAWGWGSNENGMLCLGNKHSVTTPTELPFTDVTALAGAAEHAVYDANGVLYSCGGDAYGVLGAGSSAPKDSDTPIKVANLNGADVTTLVSSFLNAGALLRTGQYYDWGFSPDGQLGDGGRTYSSVPVQVKIPDASPITQVALGGSELNNGQTLVKLADGTIYAWGDNSFNQLTPGGPTKQLSPEKITPPSGVTYASLATGGSTAYGLTTSGGVYAWGQNNHGQVGDGSTKDAKHPVKILPSGSLSIMSATARNIVVGCTDG
jgi:alpha-tubulin suppressor-like RCC1 family protein